MKVTPLAFHLVIAAVVIAFFSANPARAQEERNYLLATATTGGTYYPVGVAISTLTKVKLQPEYLSNCRLQWAATWDPGPAPYRHLNRAASGLIEPPSTFAMAPFNPLRRSR